MITGLFSRRTFFTALILPGLVMFAALTVTGCSSAAVVSMFQDAAEPAATPLPPFVLADVTKPTYTPTPSPTPLPTSTPFPTPTETPGVIEVVIVDDTPQPVSNSSYIAPSYTGSKYILVDISEQHMYIYENGGLLWSFVASTGMNNATRTGLFHVQSKIPNAYGATWNIWMPNWLGIYWAGGLENGIHALPLLPGGAELWAGYLGSPISYGCVVLGSYEASLLYNWAEIGTPVEIRW